MPDTGERREITRFVNANEVETVQEATKLVAKVEQQSRKAVQESRSRKRRNITPRSDARVPAKAQESQLDREASERMADEGDPNPKP